MSKDGLDSSSLVSILLSFNPGSSIISGTDSLPANLDGIVSLDKVNVIEILSSIKDIFSFALPNDI